MGSIQIAGKNDLPGGHFFLPPEVWHMVGEKIESLTQLRSLVQTCRAFRDIFSPMAYATRTIQLHSAPPWEWKYNLIPSSIALTQNLEINLEEFKRPSTTENGYHGDSYERRWPAQYAAFITKVLQKIENLRMFQWKDSSVEPNPSPALMIKDSRLLNRLKKCQSLEGLSVEFSPISLERTSNTMHRWIPLNGFANLTSLELYSFRGDVEKIVKEIAGVLSRSPNLKVLGLAMNCNYLRQDQLSDDEVIIVDDSYNFMHLLCVEYELRNPKPLSLHTLRLGNGIYLEMEIDFSKPVFGSPLNNYLLKLIDVTKLEKMTMFNGLVISEGEIEREPDVEWRLLEQCTSLRQLSVTRLGDELIDWLAEGDYSFGELLIMHHFDMESGLLEIIDTPLNLSMLVLWEKTSLQANDEEMLFMPGPVRDVGTETLSMFDRIAVINNFLERLSICIEFEDQWERFETHLTDLTQLRELRLNCKSIRTGQYPPKVSSLWPGVTKSKDIARKYAELAKTTCNTLQLIRIGYWAWRFLPSIETDTLGSPAEITMQELDWDEIMSIELFALGKYPSDSGLPEKDQWIDPTSDDEFDDSEEFYYELAWAERHLPAETVEARRVAIYQELFGDPSDAPADTPGSLTRPQKIARFGLGNVIFNLRNLEYY